MPPQRDLWRDDLPPGCAKGLPWSASDAVASQLNRSALAQRLAIKFGVRCR